MKKIREINLKNKKVIVRVDFNVPIESGIIEDDNRIRQSLKTINYLIENNAKIILLSHLGKVKTKEDKIVNSLKIVYERLKQLANTNVYFSNETRGLTLEEKINSLKEKEILLVENTRFEDLKGNLESGCDEELSKYWASLGDIFVLDAFGSAHRNHASTYGIGKYLPSFIGFLIEEELNVLEEVLNNKDKTVILGGAKVEDKIGVIKKLVNNTNKIIIGGRMCFTFLKALGYDVKNNFVDEEKLEEIKLILKSYKDKIILPIDFISNKKVVELGDINEECFDIGPKTIDLIKKELLNSSIVLWNGPLGKFEEEIYEKGTKSILNFLNEKNIKTIIAGGDTGNAAHKYNLDFYYISTGGGASLEYLSGTHFKTLDNMK